MKYTKLQSSTSDFYLFVSSTEQEFDIVTLNHNHKNSNQAKHCKDGTKGNLDHLINQSSFFRC